MIHVELNFNLGIFMIVYHLYNASARKLMYAGLSPL